MAFTTWAAILSDFKNHMANRDIESFFHAGYENSREMRVTYTKLGNVQAFMEWLEQKAAQEANGFREGEIPFAVGGF